MTSGSPPTSQCFWSTSPSVLLGASVIIISLVNLYRMFVLKEPVVELLTGHKADDGEDPIAKEGGGLQ